MRQFTLADMEFFPNILDDCLKADGKQGGTIHQYAPRLTVGGPAKGIRYGMRPIVQAYLDDKPLERGWIHASVTDLVTP